MVGTSNALYKNEQWLIQKYIVEKLSIRQIAEQFSCGRNTLRYQMKKLGIKRRSLSEARLLNFPDKPYRNKRILYKRYWKNGYSLSGLSELYGCDRQTIKMWLKKHGIRRRTKDEGYELRTRIIKRKRYGSMWNRISLLVKDVARSLNKYF